MSKFNSFEILTQSAQKNILNAKILEFFSELSNPRYASGETIQNSLNYWNRKKDLLIWSIVERINFLFEWNLISLQNCIQNHLEIIL